MSTSPIYFKAKHLSCQVPKLIPPYYLHLFFYLGTNDTARDNLEANQRDYRALEVTVRGLGAQIEFSSLLLVRIKSVRKRVNKLVLATAAVLQYL